MMPMTASMRVIRLNLEEPLPELSTLRTVDGASYERVMALVVLHGQPLGVVEVPAVATAEELESAIRAELDGSIGAHLTADGPVGQALPAAKSAGLPAAENLPFVSVVIPTRDRPQSVADCLAALGEMDYPNYELIVVDNAPSSDETARVVQGASHQVPLRYCREWKPGVASARNHGLTRAEGEIVAFIDDDVEPDAAWLRETVQAFGTNPRVACVTGLIFPKELETPAQVWFEQFVRFQKGFSRRVFDLRENRPTDPMFPYAIGTVGSGANFAFRTDVLRRIRGFDPALGTGSPAQGGEDLEVLFRLIQAGYAVCYEPRSMVFHSHPRDYEAVRRRSYIYGLGLTAFLLKCVLDEPRRVVEIAERLRPALSHVFGRQSAKNNRQAADFPIELRLEELKGMAVGPLAYIQSRIRSRAAVA